MNSCKNFRCYKMRNFYMSCRYYKMMNSCKNCRCCRTTSFCKMNCSKNCGMTSRKMNRNFCMKNLMNFLCKRSL